MEEQQTIQQPQSVQSAHDDFYWSVDKRNVASYAQEDRQKLEQIAGQSYGFAEKEYSNVFQFLIKRGG